MNTITIKKSELGTRKIRVDLNEPCTIVIDTAKTSTTIHLLEFQDKLFRTNSAVVLPGNQTPSESPEEGDAFSPIGIAASCLRYANENPLKKILIAGHTDTKGNLAYNKELSQKRAETVLAVLTGNADLFAEICSNRRFMINRDYNQILAWASEIFGWDCHPGAINDNGNDLVVNKFRKEYNAKGPGSTWAPKITEWGGAGGKEIWTAYFDCYEDFLVTELKTDRAGLAVIRSKCVFLIDRKWVGCSELHPRIAQNLNEFPCDNNRRVEVLFFDPGEKPSIVCETDANTCAGKACILYDRTKYPRIILSPGLPPPGTLNAYWGDSAECGSGQERMMVVEGGSITAGLTVSFDVTLHYASGDHVTATVPAIAVAGRAQIAFSQWSAGINDSVVGSKQMLDAPATFLPVEFSFSATIGPEKGQSRRIPYKDACSVKFVFDDDPFKPMRGIDFIAYSPWGTIRGKTDDQGLVALTELPPGGIDITLRNFGFDDR